MKKRWLQFFMTLLVIMMMTVVANAATVKLNKSKVNLELEGLEYEGQKTAQLRLLNTTAKVTWKSSDKSIVKVNSKGKVTAVKAGKATVTATADGKTYPCVVRVKASMASLKIKLKVTYNRKPMRVNATYYVGIFTDSKLTRRLSVMSLKLNNASSLTKEIKINILKLPSKKVTLYIAETDKAGSPMKSGASSGYKILMNGKKRNSIKVTISQFDAEKSVKIENRIL